MTLFAFPAFLIAAIAQKYLLKETLWPRLAGLFVMFYVFIYGSVDLAWILLSFFCLYEIVAHLIKASKKDRTLIRVAFTILFLCFPILVVYNIYHTQQAEGVIFYPKYSYPKTQFRTISVRGQFREIQKQWEIGSATGEKVILPEIDSIPDPFSIYKQPMAYIIDASGTSAILISRGPNLEFDLNLDSIPWEALKQDPEPFQYDPTNGSAEI